MDNESDTNIKIVKKRGRKPKNSSEKSENVNENVEEEKKIPKKRGRKPKNKPVEPKIPKKRGRKPTGKILSVNKGEISRIENDENCIIAHIPLQESDISKYSKKSSTSNDNDEMSENYDNFSESENSVSIINEKIEKGCNLNNQENELSLDNPTLFNENNNNKTASENKYIQYLEKKVDKLKKELDFHNEKNLSTDEVFSNDYNIEKLSNNIIYMEDNNLVLKNKKNMHCWWCCHKFENTPFPLPNKYYKEKFFVFGCFCSASCATSYNLDINDHKIWERNSLVIKLYNLLSDNNLDTINPALPRQSLDIFGGPYNIEEYRKSSVSIYNSRFILPPMVPITTLIEESYKERNKYKWDKKVNISRYNKLTTNIKLKRNKPLNNKPNNLEKVMGLRKIKITD